METATGEGTPLVPAGRASLREMASGIDALTLSGYGEVSSALLADLDSAKCAAREANEPVPLQ